MGIFKGAVKFTHIGMQISYISMCLQDSGCFTVSANRDLMTNITVFDCTYFYQMPLDWNAH